VRKLQAGGWLVRHGDCAPRDEPDWLSSQDAGDSQGSDPEEWVSLGVRAFLELKPVHKDPCCELRK